MTTQNASRTIVAAASAAAAVAAKPKLSRAPFSPVQIGLEQLGSVLQTENVKNERPAGAGSWSKAIRLSALFGSRLLRASLRLLVAIVTSCSSAGLKRRVAPGRRSEERYEFESTEMRQGTWGRIY